MTDTQRIAKISEIIVEWVNEPYAEIGDGFAGRPEAEYLDAILDVLARPEAEPPMPLPIEDRALWNEYAAVRDAVRRMGVCSECSQRIALARVKIQGEPDSTPDLHQHCARMVAL